MLAVRRGWRRGEAISEAPILRASGRVPPPPWGGRGMVNGHQEHTPRHITRRTQLMEDLTKAKSQGVKETVQQALKGVQFPVSKQDLVRAAQQNKVPAPIVEKLRNMPGDQYGGPQDVIQAVQQM